MQLIRRALVALAIPTVILGAATVAPQAASAATPVPVYTAVHNAASYAYAHGYRTGMAVLDTQTGAFYGAGAYAYTFASESVVKMLIATELLLHHQMHGTTASVAYKMITQSDDGSADRLYGLVGGDDVINRVEAHYHLNIGYPPRLSGWWGNTHLYPRGLVYFYNAIRHDGGVWPWLSYAMHHSTTYGSDGTYQHFGIPQATSSYAIKQGWGIDDDCFCHAVFNSTGFVGTGDRFAVAIMTSGPSSSYGSAISSMVSTQARLLMPSRYIDLLEYHNPHSALWFVHSYASTLHLQGWAIDPDARSTPLEIHVYDNGHWVWTQHTDRYYAALNQRWPGASGNHAYYITNLHVPDGVHTICVRAFNVGLGTASSLRCIAGVRVQGAPFGHLDSSTGKAGGAVTLTGWALDYSAMTQPLNLRVYDSGKFVGQYATGKLRADINARYHATGTHGFSIALTGQRPGAHVYHVYAMNTGYPDVNTLLAGADDVTVPPPPPAVHRSATRHPAARPAGSRTP